LGEGTFKAEIFKDGVNADRAGRDYKKEIITIPANKKLQIKMAPGGGFAARIFKLIFCFDLYWRGSTFSEVLPLCFFCIFAMHYDLISVTLHGNRN
jgi:Glycoside hydrolase 97.